jgi:hypothetical protein
MGFPGKRHFPIFTESWSNWEVKNLSHCRGELMGR